MALMAEHIILGQKSPAIPGTIMERKIARWMTISLYKQVVFHFRNHFRDYKIFATRNPSYAKFKTQHSRVQGCLGWFIIQSPNI